MPVDPIEHVIVLMLENQSFDRMVGLTSGADGVDLRNLRSNPNSSTGIPVVQNPSTQVCMDFDPPHDYDDVVAQLAGTGAPCSGFVDAFLKKHPTGNPPEIMAFYDRGTLPALETLAPSFVLCDRWFSSVPGPTWPNRFFVHSGTSLGHVDMPSTSPFDPAIHLYDQPTVFQRISEAGKRWLIYFEDFAQTTLMTHQLLYAANYRFMARFEQDCQNAATFPDYVFLEPKYFSPGQNDQHPTCDIGSGDALIARVYNALRQNDALWNTSLFVVLYDEHGGFYDHVDPREPAYRAKAVPPDAHKTPEGFAFDQFGLRVPALLISPWLDSGVLHGAYDHTSLLKYLTAKWGLGPLGARTAAANNFAEEIVWRTALRTDTPLSLPVQTPPQNAQPTQSSEHQQCIISYSQYLESKRTANAPVAASPGVSANASQAPLHEALLAPAGPGQAETANDPVQAGAAVAERLRLYLNAHGASLPAPKSSSLPNPPPLNGAGCP